MNLLVIPARYGSARFPGKPLAKIAGVPMVVMVYERVNDCNGFDDVMVATDDQRISDELVIRGYDSKMTPDDCLNGTERCAYVADYAGLADDDIIVDVQGDEPMMLPVIPQRILFNVELAPSWVWTAVRKLRPDEFDNPDVTKCHVIDGMISDWSRKYLPGYDHVQIGVYGYTALRLRQYMDKPCGADEACLGLEQLRWREPLACIEIDYDGIAVDRPEDIAKVEERLQN